MKLQDLNDLDINDIGIWPLPVKIALILILCVLMGIGWYYYNTEEQLEFLAGVERKEVELRGEF